MCRYVIGRICNPFVSPPFIFSNSNHERQCKFRARTTCKSKLHLRLTCVQLIWPLVDGVTFKQLQLNPAHTLTASGIRVGFFMVSVSHEQYLERNPVQASRSPFVTPGGAPAARISSRCHNCA